MQCPVGRVRVPMNVLPFIKSSQAEKPKKGIGSQVSYKVMLTLFFFVVLLLLFFLDWD